jgi:hypothetical protein
LQVNAPYPSEVAREIDRLVVRGHEVAGGHPTRPPPLGELDAHPALLNTVAVVLLDLSLGRDDVQRIVAYTPAHMVAALIDDNVAKGVVADDDGRVALTERGRPFADAIVTLQEDAIATMWAGAEPAMETVRAIAADVVDRAIELEPPIEPPTFPLFAAVWRRPELPAQVLRLITAMRYWRADAHRRALRDAGLAAHEAHALNRLWDVSRGVQRFGQGFPAPGGKGLADLQERGLADGEAITAAGIELREQVERATDEHTEPLYGGLDDGDRDRLLRGLRDLPADDPAPGIPGLPT